MNRLTAALITTLCILASSTTWAQGDFDAAEYKRALWMTTRFYGAQRSGHGPNWLLMEHPNPEYRTSFTQDAKDGHDLEGGWFDCGDHVTFGHTFFYSVYVLAKAYEMFPTGFHDLYDGKNYSGYMESGNWDMEGGNPNGIPDLLEELKYATDWIIKATPDANTFYYEKGNGEYDHATWVTAGKMSTQPVEEGGEPRPIYSNPEDGRMASFAAAALAVMSRIYKKYDSTYTEQCIEHARNAYDYASPRKNQSVGAASGGFYGPGKDPLTTFLIGAAEMYKSTGEDKYKNDVTANIGEVKTHYYALDYSNPHDLAPFAVSTAVPEEKSNMLEKMKTIFVDEYVNSVNGEQVCTKGNSGWGALRYPANHAFSVALYSTGQGTSEYDQFIFDQVDYIMGSNDAGQSFIVGFCSGCQKEPSLPHHRNVFLRDDNPDDDGKAQMTIPERNKQFGQLMGGTWQSSSYSESVTDYAMTEGGIDYNAGLVGALGYLVSKIDPADTSTFTGEPSDPPQQSVLKKHKNLEGIGLTLSNGSSSVTFLSGMKNQVAQLSIFSLSGAKVFSSPQPGKKVIWNTSNQPRGIYVVNVKMKSGKSIQENILLK